ncbi:hypothetical protein SAMN05444157_3598 [Frankineae bacterium MT45]|nr:hypothetical protein SAMN05444157_3598 [Frankineae bacterium MT45]
MRALLVWVTIPYEWNEAMYERTSFFTYRLAFLGGALAAGAVGGGVGFLIAALASNSREAGFWIGVSIVDCLLFAAVTYIVIGWLVSVALNRKGR